MLTSASHQLAQHFFRLRALLRVLRFADRTGLPSQLQAKQLIFQRVQVRAYCGINLRELLGSCGGMYSVT